MISISKNWINVVAPGVVIETCPGLFASPLYSFGGGGNAGLDTIMLDEELAAGDRDGRDREQVRLTLIGQADRYDAAARRGVTVVQICPDDGAQPTASEARQVVDVLLSFAYGVRPGIDRLLDRLRVIGGLQSNEEAQALADADVRLNRGSGGTACACGHAAEEHGGDDEYPGSTACSECPDGDCIAFYGEG